MVLDKKTSQKKSLLYEMKKIISESLKKRSSRKRMKEEYPYTNRLIHQKSPYLIQHAHNPVDWYPWGDEAFNAAKYQDKPIFLSIGYATCHWCHVMEKESFEDPEVAKLLNEAFINIKVDREELPEVDGLYMEFAQSMMSGSAGWPLNVILTPELQPFFAATYLPPHGRHGLMGLIDLIQRIKGVWSGEEREQVMLQASKIVEVFADSVHVKGDEFPEKEQVDDAAELLFRSADPVFGGMKGAPKFPIGYQSNFMLHYSATSNDSRAPFLVERTLTMMHRGGIYDHLGGGFSRYSVDEQWLTPHFEKMIYDNALLSFAYLEAWQLTKKTLYKSICQEILEYVLREMTHPQGGFFSAEDADSEGKEGFFYTWDLNEIQNILGQQESQLFSEFYGVSEEGNFEGRNILHEKFTLEEFAILHKRESQDLALLFAEQKHLLWKVRESRKHPLKDDKILSSWNGLMIHSLIEAGCAFAEKRYFNAGIKAAEFIKKNLWKPGQLFRRWREGESLYHAGLDEYAALIRGTLSLFEAGLGTAWLEWAIEMTQILSAKFKEAGGAFYQTDGLDENIILRKCQFSDGAEPSGNALHCENLLRLYQLTGNINFLEQAEDILTASKKYLDTYPLGYCWHMMNLNRYYDKNAPTVVIALNDDKQYEDILRSQIYSQFIPHKAVIWRNRNDKKLFELSPIAMVQEPSNEETTLNICYAGVCQIPLNDFKKMSEAIQKL